MREQDEWAAHQGGNPPPLIAVDQEGGLVKRLPWAPPSASATAMADPAAQGRATGRALRAAGITVDLAPVADVERRPNFLGSRPMVEALLSRLRHYCHTLHIKGPSLREPQG